MGLNNMFKRGDKVKVNGCESNRVDQGEIVTIDQDNSSYPYVLRASGERTCVSAGNCKLVEELKPVPKFKIGDKIRGISADIKGCEGIIEGDTGAGWKIKITKGSSEYPNAEDLKEGVTCSRTTYWINHIELITNESSNTSQNTVGKIMNNITKFVKNMTLTADEKLLRKFGFKNDCGEYTQDAKDFAILKLCEEKEVLMVEVAKGLDKEEKASK